MLEYNVKFMLHIYVTYLCYCCYLCNVMYFDINLCLSLIFYIHLLLVYGLSLPSAFQRYISVNFFKFRNKDYYGYAPSD